MSIFWTDLGKEVGRKEKISTFGEVELDLTGLIDREVDILYQHKLLEYVVHCQSWNGGYVHCMFLSQ